MKILSLDISSNSGWAFFNRDGSALKLEEYGLIVVPKPDCEYPKQYLLWSQRIFFAIKHVIDEFKPDLIITEETSKGSKNHLSQKLLEFVHYQIATYLVTSKTRYRYFQTGEWRHVIGAKMNKNEKDNNKEVNKARAKGVKVVKNELGKRIGKVTKKHVNVRIANETFGLDLKLKNNNEADAIGMGLAYHTLFQKEDATKGITIDEIFA